MTGDSRLAKHLKTTTERHRRDVVATWRASGLSQAEFCRQEGIQEWQLSEWKRREARAVGKHSRPAQRKEKLSRTVGIEFAAAGEEMDSSMAEQIPIPTIGPFVPLVPRQPSKSRRRVRGKEKRDPVAAELRFSGLVVRVFFGADQETLRTILQTLQECSLC